MRGAWWAVALAIFPGAGGAVAQEPQPEPMQLAVVRGLLALPEDKLDGRVALLLSLHADTAVHGNDRDGLARLGRYGARGPLAEERLSRLEDGRYR